MTIDVLRIALAAQALERVDVRLEREHRIEHLLDSRQAVLLDGGADLACVASRLLDDAITDLLLAALEQGVVLREVGMTQHVRKDECVLLQRVVAGQIGAAGVARGRRPRTTANDPCGAERADRCTARRTTSARAHRQDRIRQSPS